ncbi:MAG: FprA family A-type flavoprotein [Bacteroidales bacterium]
MDRTDNRIIDIAGAVKWVGVLDYDIVTFDIVMETEFGTTYNSYFIDAKKKTIIETVQEKFWPVYLEKLKSVTNPADISYIVLDHTEPDHSGSVRHLLELAPDAIVVGSGNAIRYLEDMVPGSFKSLVVKDGDRLDLGDRTLRFVSAPNLHWPDSIYTYIEEEKLLFTCDSFGAHFCQPDLFDDEVGDYHDAFKYYFDVILKPFSKFMLKAIDRIAPLEIEMICPGHGPVLRSTWKEKVDLSAGMARDYISITTGKKIRKVLITYVSAYGYTREMAEAIRIGIESAGNVEVSVLDIEKIELGDLESEVVRCDALLVGSPTINQNTLLPVYRLFSVINPLRDKGKLAAAFGSYGWSGEAPKIISDNLRNLKLAVSDEIAGFKFMPDEEKTIELVAFGTRFARSLADCE